MAAKKRVPSAPSPAGRYAIKLHPKVISEDGKRFDARTKERIKKTCRELLSTAPEAVGAPLHFELKDYRKLRLFGRYRVVYRVYKREIVVYILTVGVRRDSEVYEEALRRLFSGPSKR